MARQFPRKWTEMTFEKPSFQNRSKFDDSGVEVEVIQALERRIPNHFLVIALIQQLCSLYIHDNQEKCTETFKVICEQLARMKILPSFALHEDFEAVREKYVTAFHGVLAAAGGDNNSLNLLPFGDNGSSFISRGPSISRQLVLVKELLEHNTSRYKEEFQQLERLGKGGFGSVYKVKNKLDSREYAVKKVHLSEKDLSNCVKVLREVKVLARLRHPNVVGYQSAWLEFVSNEKAVSSGLTRTSTHPDRLVDLDQSPGFSNIFQRLDSQDSDGSHIVFQTSEASVGAGDVSDESKEHKGHSSYSPVKLRGSLSPRHNLLSVNSFGIHKSASDANLERFTSPKSYKNSHLHNHKPKNGHFVNEDDSSKSGDSIGSESLGIVLFIQMEVCAITLREWLFERNLEIYKNGGQVNNKYNTNIFKQIVNGVKYIHSEGLIHRDLKPSNIFLHREKRYDGSYEYQVKIGDFGLARTDLFRSDPPNGNEFSSMIEPLSPLFPSGSPTSSNLLGQTLGVGTCTYASPEQLHNKSYGSKVDIYSLGIILYEFYQPFNTEMEKHKSIKEIRKGIIPEDFKKLWPNQSDLILRMMARNPHDRPTAEDILSMDIMSEKSKCHAELLKKLENEQKENEFLREKIRELELELTRKDETIMQIQTEKANCERCRKFSN